MYLYIFWLRPRISIYDKQCTRGKSLIIWDHVGVSKVSGVPKWMMSQMMVPEIHSRRDTPWPLWWRW